MHRQDGVFALLVGSGVSTGAGLPTGWDVVKDLVRRAAAANDPERNALLSEQDVLDWWTDHGTGELGYSTVLAALAPTQAGRQALLESFFEPSDDDRETSFGPSPAHRAIARLVARGAVRVILTTNFDRLLEQALQEIGVQPQVISRPEAVAGMKPLAHARATVVKLHGDYKDLSTLNTPQELAEYPSQWQGLLAQIFDEYGLVIAGWSGDWDLALTHALESAPSRRYPLYWDQRSSRGETARRLLETRDGIVLPAASADELFAEIEGSLSALDRLTQTPLSSAIAVARLKKYLHDTTQRIALHDLVLEHIDMVATAIQRIGAAPRSETNAYETVLTEYREATRPLLQLLAVGVRHDEGGQHDSLWEETLDRLVALRRQPESPFNERFWRAQHYPAILAFYTMGAATVVSGHDELFVRLGRDHHWKGPFESVELPAHHLLRPDVVLDWDSVNAMPRWSGQRWQQPPSHLVREDLRDLLRDLPPRGNVTEILDDTELRHAILVSQLPGGMDRPLTGEFRGDRNWGDQSGLVAAMGRLRAASTRQGSAWGWWPVVGVDLDAKLEALRSTLAW